MSGITGCDIDDLLSLVETVGFDDAIGNDNSNNNIYGSAYQWRRLIGFDCGSYIGRWCLL